ncbi:MAG: hypothetical protein H6Q60_810 [Oscillospiraceae bacterium]|nr:hypothetical protein [Oscillospiraceae bacterium]
MGSLDGRWIRAIMPLKDMRLFLELESGSTMTVNLTEELHTAKYGALENETLFCDVKTDGNAVVWGENRITTTLDELIDIALRGIV